MIERHHRIFRSQGGLDFELNYVYLTSEQHKGDKGPHKCRQTDLRYKRELQEALEALLTKDYYSLDELCRNIKSERRTSQQGFQKANIGEGNQQKRCDTKIARWKILLVGGEHESRINKNTIS